MSTSTGTAPTSNLELDYDIAAAKAGAHVNLLRLTHEVEMTVTLVLDTGDRPRELTCGVVIPYRFPDGTDEPTLTETDLQNLLHKRLQLASDVNIQISEGYKIIPLGDRADLWEKFPGGAILATEGGDQEAQGFFLSNFGLTFAVDMPCKASKDRTRPGTIHLRTESKINDPEAAEKLVMDALNRRPQPAAAQADLTHPYIALKLELIDYDGTAGDKNGRFVDIVNIVLPCPADWNTMDGDAQYEYINRAVSKILGLTDSSSIKIDREYGYDMIALPATEAPTTPSAEPGSGEADALLLTFAMQSGDPLHLIWPYPSITGAQLAALKTHIAEVSHVALDTIRVETTPIAGRTAGCVDIAEMLGNVAVATPEQAAAVRADAAANLAYMAIEAGVFGQTEGRDITPDADAAIQAMATVFKDAADASSEERGAVANAYLTKIIGAVDDILNDGKTTPAFKAAKFNALEKVCEQLLTQLELMSESLMSESLMSESLEEIEELGEQLAIAIAKGRKALADGGGRREGDDGDRDGEEDLGEENGRA